MIVLLIGEGHVGRESPHLQSIAQRLAFRTAAVNVGHVDLGSVFLPDVFPDFLHLFALLAAGLVKLHQDCLTLV